MPFATPPSIWPYGAAKTSGYIDCGKLSSRCGLQTAFYEVGRLINRMSPPIRCSRSAQCHPISEHESPHLKPPPKPWVFSVLITYGACNKRAATCGTRRWRGFSAWRFVDRDVQVSLFINSPAGRLSSSKQREAKVSEVVLGVDFRAQKAASRVPASAAVRAARCRRAGDDTGRGLSQIFCRRWSGSRSQDMGKLSSKQENHRRIVNPNN